MIDYHPRFLIELGDFLLIESSGFSPRFLIKFRRFFLLIHGFPFGLPLGLGGFYHIKAMISNAIYSSELISKRENNCNILKSHNQLRDKSHLIGIIFIQLIPR